MPWTIEGDISKSDELQMRLRPETAEGQKPEDVLATITVNRREVVALLAVGSTTYPLRDFDSVLAALEVAHVQEPLPAEYVALLRGILPYLITRDAGPIRSEESET